MNVKQAIEELKCNRDRKWVRWKGEDFLRETEARKLKQAGVVLIEHCNKLEGVLHEVLEYDISPNGLKIENKIRELLESH